jgi:hypothetical protein
MTYRRTATSSYPRAVLGLTFLPMARFSWCLLSNHSCCSLLKAACPEQFPHRVPVGPGLPASSSGWCSQKFLEWSILLHLWLLHCCYWSLFCFIVERPLHNVLTFLFQILTNGSTFLFTISHTRAFLKILPDVLSFPRRSCSCMSQSLIPLLSSWRIQRLFPNICPFEVLLATLFLVHFLMTVSLMLCRNGMAGHPSEGGSQLLPGPTTAMVCVFG